MDTTNIAGIVAGPDGVGGTPDDLPLDFATGAYRTAEGTTGTEDLATRLGFALTR